MQELELQFQFLFAGFPFLVPLALVLLLTHRVVAKQFGAERLFWNESIVVQLGAFFSVGMLVGVTLFVWYLIDRPNWAATQCQGSRVTLFGLDTTNRGYELRTVGTYLLVWLFLYGLLLFVPKWIVAYRMPTVDDKRNQFLKSRKYLWPGMLGYALSIPFAMLLHAVRHHVQPDIWQLRLDNLMDESFDGNPILAKWKSDIGTSFSVEQIRFQIYELHTVALYLGLLAVLLTAVILVASGVVRKWSGCRAKVVFGPMVLLSLMLIIFVTFYGSFVFNFRMPVISIFAIAAWWLFLNAYQFRGRYSPDKHKMRFVDLDPEYDNLVTLEPIFDPLQPLTDTTPPRPGPVAKPPIDGADVLRILCERWQATHQDGTKPKIVLFACSGGGIRAAAWTGVVLEGLEQYMPSNFPDHIRLMSGASGGMVGAAMYAADFDRSRTDRGRVEPTKEDKEVGLCGLSGSLAEQSLLPLVQTMILRDFFLAPMLPKWMLDYFSGSNYMDRGQRTQWKWGKNAECRGYETAKTPFDRTFADLYDLEAVGRRPSLIVPPMLVDDGRRLLISNLDLSQLASPSVWPMGEPENGPYSRSMLEFFRLFPNSHERFTIGTASRMAASFPFFAPAVSLPTLPARRPVDGGYFDNYGIDVLSNWLMHHRDDVLKYTGGVLLVEVRAFPLKDANRSFEPDYEWEPAAWDLGPLVRGIVDPIGTPLHGIIDTRVASQYLRNRMVLKAVDQTFNCPKREDFFRSIVFELDKDASLNWYISSVEKQVIVEEFFTDTTRTTLSELAKPRVDAMRKWFGNGGA